MSNAHTAPADASALVTVVVAKMCAPGQPKLVTQHFEVPADFPGVVGLELAGGVVSIQVVLGAKVEVDFNGKSSVQYVHVSDISPEYYIADTFNAVTGQILPSTKPTLTMLWLPNGSGRVVAVREPAVSEPPQLAAAQV